MFHMFTKWKLHILKLTYEEMREHDVFNYFAFCHRVHCIIFFPEFSQRFHVPRYRVLKLSEVVNGAGDLEAISTSHGVTGIIVRTV